MTNPENGLLLSTKEMFHFGDIVRFHCNFGYVMDGSATLLCTSNGIWNGTMPKCDCKYYSSHFEISDFLKVD